MSAGTLLQLPPNPAKQTLGLTQRYLVLQLRPLAKKPVTIEINILSLKDKRQRYRLHLSHKFRTVEVHQLHVQVPLSPLLTPDMWTHFIVDVAELTSYFFKNKDFGSIDSVGLHSGCRLRVSASCMSDHQRASFLNHCVFLICIRKCLHSRR